MDLQKAAADHDPLNDPLQFGMQDEPLVGPGASVFTCSLAARQPYFLRNLRQACGVDVPTVTTYPRFMHVFG